MHGTAGFIFKIALVSLTPVNFLMPSSVVAMYSSIFERVAGPALLEEILETVSIYSIFFCVLARALAKGIDA